MVARELWTDRAKESDCQRCSTSGSSTTTRTTLHDLRVAGGTGEMGPLARWEMVTPSTS